MKKALSLLLLISITFFQSIAKADYLGITTGMLNANIGGALTTSFSVAPTIGFDFIQPVNLYKSFLISTQLANDMSSAQTKYFGITFGHRHYMGGAVSGPIELNSTSAEKTDYVKISSKNGYFYDYSFGLGQVQTYLVTLSLNITSTVLVGNAGIGYQQNLWSENYFFTKFNLGYGFGMSSVAATAMMIHIQLGYLTEF